MQTDISWHNKQYNLKRAAMLLEKARENDCEVALFPEMFSTGFSMDREQVAEPPNGPVLTELCNLARKFNLSIIAGIAEKSEDIFENRAYFIPPEGEVQHYTKNYGFSYTGENKMYCSGDEQLVFDLNGVSSSVFICYDLRFPELFRKVARSVSIIFVIANWPDSRIAQWDILLKARAIENQCFVVAVNRKGTDGNGLEYNGHSTVINPLGEEVDLFRLDGECRCFEIDEEQTSFVRQRFPFLKDFKG